MMRFLKNKIGWAPLWFAAVLLTATVASANDTDDGLQDPLTPVRILMKSGRWSNAETALKRIVTLEIKRDKEIHENEEDVEHVHLDLLEANALMGIIDVQFERHQSGIKRLERVLRERPNKTSLWIYLAQAKASTGDHEGALVALDKCKDLSARLPGWFILKSRSEAELQKMDQAGNTLKDGLVVFPGNLDLLREKCMLMFLMGLYNEAARTAASMFTADSSDFSAFLMMGEALRKVGNFRDSILILEEGVLRFPKETQLKTQLAYVYALDGQHLAAARLFERLTRSGQDLAFETADQYRLAGRHQDALKWNGKVKNGQRRQNQRLAIAISGKLYALACSMAAQLEHCGQVGDNTSYQLAYSCFRHGDFPQSIRFLDRISDPTLASSAQGIRDAISRVM